jgi:hypothetical protein
MSAAPGSDELHLARETLERIARGRLEVVDDKPVFDEATGVRAALPGLAATRVDNDNAPKRASR